MTSVLLVSCEKQSSPYYPPPTDTHFLTDMEGNKKRSLKHAWFELQHQSAEGVDWKEIERQRAFTRHKEKCTLGKLGTRNSQVSIANDQIVGEWLEKGSNNLAGSILKTTYDMETGAVYAIAAGGSLWMGTENGDWNLLNDDLRFDGKILNIAVKIDGTKQLNLSIGGIPYYSDIGGIEVFRSSGYPPGGKNLIIASTSINQGSEVFILVQRSEGDAIDMYYSENGGLNYSKLKDFEGNAPEDFAMAKSQNENTLFIIESFGVQNTRLYKWDKNTKKFALILANMDIDFGANGKANLALGISNSNPILFLYDDFGNFYKSLDKGVSWTFIEKLPAVPWSVGIVVSKSNPDLMMLGEIDCHRSIDGGKSWQRINYWWEYYIDELGKLHADIMDISEFRRPNGSYFSLISNHGGISYTENFGLTNINISLEDLNVSQYYDAKTYPFDTDWVVGASQDQGFQISKDVDEESLAFDQIRAGDYSHITFTGEEEKHSWVVYPLGEVNYYEDLITESEPLRFTGLEKIHNTIWLPPINKRPNSKNEVYLAGGNLDGGSGSHIIKLFLNQNRDEILATQLPFDFTISGGEIASLAFNQFDDNLWYVATTNGQFYISNDGGQSFNLQSYDLPESQYLYASKILPSKVDPSKLFICGSGYSNPAVIYSDDGGLNFYPLDRKLPKTAGFDMALSQNDEFLFLASEAGPMVYIFDEESWFPMDGDIAPNQSYWSVEYLPSKKKVRFGTYGRGIWDFDILFSTATSHLEITSEMLKIFPNPAIDEISIKSKLYFPDNSNLTILDAQGQEILKTTLKANEKIVDCSKLKPGIYFLVFNFENKHFSKSFIKI